MDYGIILLDIGLSNRVGVNHIIGAITDRTGISGNEIGKVEISADQSLVEIPKNRIEQVLEEMKGCKICGKPTHSVMLAAAQRKASRPSSGTNKGQSKSGRGNSRSDFAVKNKARHAN